MKRYEIEYVCRNEHTYLTEIKYLPIYGGRKEMLETVKEMKKKQGVAVTNVYSISNNEVYTKIKF